MVQVTSKCTNIGTLNIIALHPFPTSEDYQIVFQNYSKHTLQENMGGMGTVLPICYFEKSLQVEQLRKTLSAYYAVALRVTISCLLIVLTVPYFKSSCYLKNPKLKDGNFYNLK